MNHEKGTAPFLLFMKFITKKASLMLTQAVTVHCLSFTHFYQKQNLEIFLILTNK